MGWDETRHYILWNETGQNRNPVPSCPIQRDTINPVGSPHFLLGDGLAASGDGHAASGDNASSGSYSRADLIA